MAHSLVIKGGRVIDPESGLDAIRNVGVTGGRIEAITDADLENPKVQVYPRMRRMEYVQPQIIQVQPRTGGSEKG